MRVPDQDRAPMTERLYLAAGMPRSGSTWLYNALRLALASRHPDLVAGWIGDAGRLPASSTRLLKLHEFDPELARRASFTVWSYRDPRDALASLERKFGKPPTLRQVDDMLRWDEHWTRQADYVMRYEDFVADKRGQLARLLERLGLGEAGLAARIEHELEHASYDSQGPRNAHYHEVTLMHRGHVTDGRVGSWRGQLDRDLERAIVERHRPWLLARGYETDHLEQE
uniref:Uncharacterized protein n=1 Tax=Rubrivivax gelatinosus S1 TaxID=1138313 RepID=L8BAP2_RUBGE|nr:hypothetical protein RGS1_70351 [Rubrivivax gelatinosus S1]